MAITKTSVFCRSWLMPRSTMPTFKSCRKEQLSIKPKSVEENSTLFDQTEQLLKPKQDKVLHYTEELDTILNYATKAQLG